MRSSWCARSVILRGKQIKSWLVVEPTQVEKYDSENWVHLPQVVRVNIKNIRNHHLKDVGGSFNVDCPFTPGDVLIHFDILRSPNMQKKISEIIVPDTPKPHHFGKFHDFGANAQTCQNMTNQDNSRNCGNLSVLSHATHYLSASMTRRSCSIPLQPPPMNSSTKIENIGKRLQSKQLFSLEQGFIHQSYSLFCLGHRSFGLLLEGPLASQLDCHVPRCVMIPPDHSAHHTMLQSMLTNIILGVSASEFHLGKAIVMCRFFFNLPELSQTSYGKFMPHSFKPNLVKNVKDGGKGQQVFTIGPCSSKSPPSTANTSNHLRPFWKKSSSSRHPFFRRQISLAPCLIVWNTVDGSEIRQTTWDIYKAL